jgi:hypothetical protein
MKVFFNIYLIPNGIGAVSISNVVRFEGVYFFPKITFML